MGMPTKKLTKPVSMEEYQKVLNALSKNGYYHKNGYNIVQYHPEEKSPNGKTLCEEWDITRDDGAGDIELAYVRRNYNNIPYERRYPLIRDNKDVFLMLNNKIKESAKNPNIEVYQRDYEKNIREIDKAMKALHLEGHSIRAPRRRATSKKRAPAVRVDFRKML